MRANRHMYLIIMIILTMFLFSCKETPESEIIKNKDGQDIESSILASAYPSPNNRDDSIQNQYQETLLASGISLAFSSEIVEPKIGKNPVAKVSSKVFGSEDELKKIVTGIFPDADIFKREAKLSKNDIEAELIRWKEYLYKAENDLPIFDGDDKLLVEEKESMIEFCNQTIIELEQDYISATNDFDNIIPDYTFEVGEDGESMKALFNVKSDGKLLGEIDVINSDELTALYYYANKEIKDIDLLPISKNEFNVSEQICNKKKEIDSMMQNMGIDYMSLYSAMASKEDDSIILNYTRNISGLNESYVTEYFGTKVVGVDGAAYRSLWGTEYFQVRIDGDEVVRIVWENPSQLDKIENNDVQIMSFDEAVAAYKKYADQQFGEPLITSDKVIVSDIELSLVKVLKKDEANYYRLIPAWSFFIESSIWDDDTTPVNPNHICSITINAIDGSTIDRGVMY